ncbi:MAG: hypothetical protein LCH52_05590 [Bacteroidetes bacterium]|nr:hypothetical protein [Bacteroidota bacterium]
MQTEITKSSSLTKDSRIQVAISRELHYLVSVEAAKRRLKVKDLITHFLEAGLSQLGVETSVLKGEVEQEEVA